MRERNDLRAAGDASDRLRTVTPTNNLRLRFIDLFAGLGGFHLALSSLGHDCALASEVDPELQGSSTRRISASALLGISGTSSPRTCLITISYVADSHARTTARPATSLG